MFGATNAADLAVSVTVDLSWGSAFGPMLPFFPPIAGDMSSLSVTLDSTSVGSFSIELDGWDTKSQDYSLLGDGRLATGNRLQIDMGNDNGSATLVSGLITGSSCSVSKAGVNLSVTGFDRRHILRQGRYLRSFTGQTALEIAETIIKNRGLSVKTTKAMGAAPPAIATKRQVSGSDYEMITDLLGKVGYRLDVEGDKLHIRPPSTKPTNPFALVPLSATSVRSFSANESVVELIDGAMVIGFDRETQTQVVGKAGTVEASFLGTPTVFMKLDRAETVAEANAMAEQILAERQRTNVSANVSCPGNVALLPEEWVDLSGFGTYDGAYRITQAVHRWNPSEGYTTDLTLEQDGG